MKKVRANLGDGEFGEIYHTAVARWINPNYRPNFVNFDSGKEFFEIFFPTSSFDFWPRKQIHLSETACWIFDHFHGGIQEKLWKEIKKIAGEEEWSKELDSTDLYSPIKDKEKSKILIWIRNKKDHAKHRNSTEKSIQQLIDLANENQSLAILIGPRADAWEFKGDYVELGEFYEHDFFSTNDIAKQLFFLDSIHRKYGAKASVGMMSGAMDGLALFCGHKVIFFADERDCCPRMFKVSSVAPRLQWQEIHFDGTFGSFSKTELDQLRLRIWS